MRRFLLIVSFLILASTSLVGQTPADQDVDLMQRSQMVAEIKKLRSENDVLKDQNNLLKAQVQTFNLLNKVQEDRIVDLKTANVDFKEALLHSKNSESLSDKMESLYKERIFDINSENQRLRTENDKLRKSRDRRSLIFGIAGLALGHFLF